MERCTDLLSRSAGSVHAHTAVYRALGEPEKRLSGDGFERVMKGAVAGAGGCESVTAEKWKSKFGVSFETARSDLTIPEEGVAAMRTVSRKHFYDVAAKNGDKNDVYR